MVDERLRARTYTREVGDDMAEVRDWVWRPLKVRLGSAVGMTTFSG